MASGPFYRRSDNVQCDYLPFSDILKFFNNPVNEEQAWAVCFQCAQYYLREQSQEKYQALYEKGLQSVCIGTDGEILIQSDGRNGSAKGPPGVEYYPYRRNLASEHDAVQTLGRIIFEALDFGIGESEERTLSHELEVLIDSMTRCEGDEEGEETDTESQSADDEGIEKDAGDDHQCTFRDVAKLCKQRLTSRQEASYHYRAVCRALVAEAVELHTFLDKIAQSREKLQQELADPDCRLLDLERADWARLWMQVMRTLRQGVRLKKIDQVHLQQHPVEYELTPFEILLEDIRLRRYTLHKTMVNGDLAPKVRNDAHAVILDFIRSRPPLRQVKDRKLKSLPPKSPDPHERLLQDIRSQPKLKPLSHGPPQVEISHTKLSNQDSPPSVRRLIKPDFDLLLSSSFEDSGDSEVDSPEKVRHLRCSPLTSPAKAKDTMNATWPTEGVLGSGHDTRNTKLQRRHTIMVCESPSDGRLAALQELPPLQEEEEPSPTEDQLPRLQRGVPLPYSLLSSLPHHMLHNGHHALLRPNTTTTITSTPSATAGRHQGALYRSEHRRSLTMGLTAIPEDEDSPDGAGNGEGGTVVTSRRHSLPAAPHRQTGMEDFVPQTLTPQKASVGDRGMVLSAGALRDRQELATYGARSDRRHKRGSGGQEEESESPSGELPLLSATRRMNKRWQNPIECLSLTLEEVTHIRWVLTKAELESLLAHPELYSQVSKSKVCFTCKTTRFALFREWGTKCRFCKRTICSKCIRKIHVPTEPLKDIPVYTLIPSPLSRTTLALIHSYVRSDSARSQPPPLPLSASSRSPQHSKSPAYDAAQRRGKHPLQRSQSLSVVGKKTPAASRGSQQARSLSSRGVATAACCDCKSMVTEIVAASQAAIAVLQSWASSPQSRAQRPSSTTPTCTRTPPSCPSFSPTSSSRMSSPSSFTRQ